MTDSKNKFEIRTFAWSDHSTRPQGGIALDLLSAFFALLSSNLLASGEDLDRGAVVTGIKPRNTRNTRKRNGKRFPCQLPCISRIPRLLFPIRIKIDRMIIRQNVRRLRSADAHIRAFDTMADELADVGIRAPMCTTDRRSADFSPLPCHSGGAHASRVSCSASS